MILFYRTLKALLRAVCAVVAIRTQLLALIRCGVSPAPACKAADLVLGPGMQPPRGQDGTQQMPEHLQVPRQLLCATQPGVLPRVAVGAVTGTSLCRVAKRSPGTGAVLLGTELSLCRLEKLRTAVFVSLPRARLALRLTTKNCPIRICRVSRGGAAQHPPEHPAPQPCMGQGTQGAGHGLASISPEERAGRNPVPKHLEPGVSITTA